MQTREQPQLFIITGSTLFKFYGNLHLHSSMPGKKKGKEPHSHKEGPQTSETSQDTTYKLGVKCCLGIYIKTWQQWHLLSPTSRQNHFQVTLFSLIIGVVKTSKMQ